MNLDFFEKQLLIDNFSEKLQKKIFNTNCLVIGGGGIANTFIAAAGYGVGSSLFEADLVDTARGIAEQVDIPIPVDVMVAGEFASEAVGVVKAIDDVAEDEMIAYIASCSPSSNRMWIVRK